MSLREAAARHELDKAVLAALLSRDYAHEADAHADAQAELADERVAWAARELVRAIDHQPPHAHPVGWDKPAAMTGAELAAAILHYAEGTIAPVAFWPLGCNTCAQAVALYERVVATYPAEAADTGG